MSIDMTKERFDFEPSSESAGAYLAVATTYWRDKMISDAEYGVIVQRVAEWLCDGESEESTSAEIKAAYAAELRDEAAGLSFARR